MAGELVRGEFFLSVAYEPSRGLAAKISRRLTPYMARRMVKFELERPLVSFTFDDCPVSAITHGVKPLEALGWQSTVYVACGLLGTTNHHGLQISEGDVKALHASGHEIGGHTYSHTDAMLVDLPDFLSDIQKNQAVLAGMGLPASRTFAYPYGQTAPAVKLALARDFDGLRGITPGTHVSRADLNQIKSVPLFSGADIDAALDMIAALKETPAWITFFTHDISDTPSEWGCTPDDMIRVIKAVQELNANVLPVDKAIDYLKATS